MIISISSEYKLTTKIRAVIRAAEEAKASHSVPMPRGLWIGLRRKTKRAF